jgi:5-methylcytosine-specific restriction protein B
MSKYFPISRIKRAIEHLQNYNSNWVLVPLVFAVNDVNTDDEVNVRDEGKPGTDAFFSKYFNGSLIGLEAFDNGKNTLRPRFYELLNSLRAEDDFILHQKMNLWGNNYSSRGYREMVLAGLVEGTGSRFKLNPTFWAAWQENLPESFRFSELLVWLYAFQGVPDHIDDWDALHSHFQEEHIGDGRRFRQGYGTRFNVVNAKSWEDNFLVEKPSFGEYQQELIPSIFREPLPELKETNTFASQILYTDTKYLEVKDLINDGFAGVIFTGPPGTSKSWYAAQIGLRLVDDDPERIRFIQFHSSYQYEDFVEGFVPENGTFTLKPKHLLEMANLAKDNEDKMYVLVIDELSRSDPSRVFGEALTYVEMSKRGLPFHLSSGNSYKIPPNLIFLATMNPTDRGVDEVEQAFERRFAKISMEPSVEMLDHILTTNALPEPTKARLLEFFLYLIRNKRITSKIGHAYFHRIKDAAGLKRLWDNQLRFHFERQFPIASDGFREVENRWNRIFEEEATTLTDGAAPAAPQDDAVA